MSTYRVITEDELYHGILGQKWGVRRYQNRDGSLTEAGRRRLRKTYDKEVSRTEKKANVYKTFSEGEKKAAETLRKEGRDANEVRDTYAKVKSDPTLEKVYIDKGKKIEDHYDMDAAAMDIIRGKYGNGQERKDELGEDYAAVQKRVNELMKEMGKTSSTKKKEEETKSDTSKNLRDRGYSSSTDGYNSKKKEVKHSYTVVTSDELYHHGIIGQKWGVRRFQNSNGSLTAAGKQRYSKSGMTQRETDTFVNESYKILTSTDNVSKSLNKIKKSEAAKKKDKMNHEKYKKVSEMSDQELREFLNRYDMEQRYKKIINENKKDILTGSEVAKEVLNVTKDMAAVAVSAATLYAILNSKK